MQKTFLDYFSIALATFGVGFIPFAPGTWGSAVGVVIFLLVRKIELDYLAIHSSTGQAGAWLYAANSIFLLAFCWAGIWASTRAAQIFQKKDPSYVVVDEVMGQLITFLFVPFAVSWQMILAGFLLFRLFDIWKPYPVRTLEVLPEGLGICADDIVAGVYAGICLAIIYAVSFVV